MASQPQVTVRRTEPTTVAFIACQGPYSGFPQALGRLMAWTSQRGLAPAGPPSAVYYNSPMEVATEELRWEVRWPVAAGATPEEPNAEGLGVKPVEAAEVATTMHKGPFDEIGATYGLLMAWVAQNGYQVAGPPEEVYLSDLATVAPSDLLTEVRLPIARV